MEKVRPIYKRILLGAIVFYVVATCFMISELYYRIMYLEHKVMHITGEHSGEIAH